MKKIFLLFSIIIPFLYSCSSDESLIPEESKMTKEVRINIKGVEEFSTNLKSSLTGNSNIEVLYYSLFKEEEDQGDSLQSIDKIVFIKGQILKKGEFNNVITENLTEGSYRITLLATTVDTDLISVYPFNLTPNKDFKALYINCGFWIHTNTSDYFFKEIEFEVKNNPINESATLKRLTGKVEIIPSDVTQVPLNLKKVEFMVATKQNASSFGKLNVGQKFNYYTQKVIFETYTPTDYVTNDPSLPLISKSYTREDLLEINEKNPISLFMLETENTEGYPIYARFEYQDGTFGYTIIKSDYEIVRNKVLRLKGNLFKKIEIGDIGINDEWKTVINDVFD